MDLTNDEMDMSLSRACKPIQLNANQSMACGLPIQTGSEHNVIHLTHPFPEYTSSQESNEACFGFHVGCPLTLQWICQCQDYALLAAKTQSSGNHEALAIPPALQQLLHHRYLSVNELEHKQDIKTELRRRYAADDELTEAVLDIDVELETWRRQCFSERDQLFRTLDAPEFEHLAQHSETLAREYIYVPEDYPRSIFHPQGRGEERRPKARSWPPNNSSKEPSTTYTTRRGRPSLNALPKRFQVKGLVNPDLEDEQLQLKGRICSHCGTQRTPLWRKGWPVHSSALASPFSSSNAATGDSNEAGPPAIQQPQVDLCHGCFLHWKNGTLVGNLKSRPTTLRKKRLSASDSTGKIPPLKVQVPGNPMIKKIKTVVESSQVLPVVAKVAEPADVMNEEPTLVDVSKVDDVGDSRKADLRAKGQYCPVCTHVYEDDDVSSFIYCDQCLMWVHTACDETLTSVKLGAATYRCPNCVVVRSK